MFHSVATPGTWEKEQVNTLLKKFVVPRETLENIMLQLNTQFTQGLKGDSSSELLMIPTYVRSIPTGKEHGKYFALDLGGTNFRVLLLDIKDGSAQSNSKVYPISQELMTGTSDQLFDYIAKCLAEFAFEQLGKDNKTVGPIGFTFSFPVTQVSLTSGKLERWTKGFSVKGVPGEDISALLMKAVEKRKDIQVDRVALLNDTTGCMLSCGFHDQDVMVGLILGTGTNACYMERLSNIPKWNEPKDNLPEQVIINTEWGAFGSHSNGLHAVTTVYDRDIDVNSINPGQQFFEKMISGMYLGELCRLIILDLIKDHILFKGVVSEEINTRNSFETRHVSDFCTGETKVILEILTSLGYSNAMLIECQVIQDICYTVSLRAARLAAAGLATIIRRLGRNSLTVAVDGSLFKKHPTFKRFMQQTLDELLPWTRVKLRLSEDGSGKGAALVAAGTDK